MILYIKPNCPLCDVTRQYLNAKGVTYEEIDITTSEEAMAFVAGLGYTQAPISYINKNNHWSGIRYIF